MDIVVSLFQKLVRHLQYLFRVRADPNFCRAEFAIRFVHCTRPPYRDDVQGNPFRFFLSFLGALLMVYTPSVMWSRL